MGVRGGFHIRERGLMQEGLGYVVFSLYNAYIRRLR